jgi:hypothetical protein
MSLDNLISVEFTIEEQEQLDQALTTIETLMKDKVVNLTPDERQQYGKINDRTENWVVKVQEYMSQKPELVPFYIQKSEFDKDINARGVLMPALRRLASIQEGMDDTAKLISHDVFYTAIAYYRNIKLVSKQNVPGTDVIYEDLKSRFPGRPASVPEEPEDPQDN